MANRKFKSLITFDQPSTSYLPIYGPLIRYVKLQVAHAPGMLARFPPPTRVSDPDMHQGTCVTRVPWCMLGSLTSGFLWRPWRGKCSRHSQYMRNPQLTYLVRGPWETHWDLALISYVVIGSVDGLCLFVAKIFPTLMLRYCQLDP